MNSKKQTFLVFLISIFFLSGCEKKLINYRNKWVGEYRFSYSVNSWIMGGPYYSADNLETTGRIYYDKKESKNNIVIEIDDIDTYKGDVYKFGTLEICGVTGSFLDKNNIEFTFSSQQCGGGLGGGITYDVVGVKKKN